MVLKNILIEHLNGLTLKNTAISLKPLVNYLQNSLDCEDGKRHLLPCLSLEIIKETEEKHGVLTESNLHQYERVFKLIHSLEAGLHVKEQGLWALGYPLPNHAFYATAAFTEFVNKEATFIIQEQTISSPIKHLLYGIILERFYGFPNRNNSSLYKIEEDGINRYYELQVDFTFVTIEPKGTLQAIDFSSFRHKDEYCPEDLEPIFQILAAENFLFSGFTIITFEDKTATYNAERLHKLIADLSQYKPDDFFAELQDILKVIGKNNQIKASLLPILKLNGYPILSSEFGRTSIFFRKLQKRNPKGELSPAVLAYLENAFPILHGIEQTLDTDDPYICELIASEGLASYLCIPLKHRKNLVGFIELYSFQTNNLTKNTLVEWESFIPLLTQLAAEIVGLFKSSLEHVIMDNFTALNPAVEWRFNEVAADLLAAYLKKTPAPLERVRFEKVFPIYGAIDVKGSSVLRNTIYRQVNQSKVGYLLDFLNKFPTLDSKLNIHELINKTHKAKEQLEAEDYEKYMLDVFLFLHEEIVKALEEIKTNTPALKPSIEIFQNKYLRNDDHHTDVFEISLQQLNSLIKQEVQVFNNKIQEIYPSYFELFRSDGVEYDMYVGQSITPTKVFNPSILREIRKQQIISMAKIGQKTAAIHSSLAVPMQVTLLIFVHTAAIDISFREDERRFDVEGGYNIRYQMVKKRIDKVHIKDSKERLVRPNTIAIVFQGDSIQEEIESLVNEIVAMGILKANYEFCDLEELQGVNELRALRADIIIDTDDNSQHN